MMRVNTILGALLLGGLLALSPALASDEDNIGEALYHAEEAVKHADLGHPSMAVEEAEKGLEYVQKLSTLEADEHLKMVADALSKVIEHGKKGNAEIAGKHAKVALDHLTQHEESQ